MLIENCCYPSTELDHPIDHSKHMYASRMCPVFVGIIFHCQKTQAHLLMSINSIRIRAGHILKSPDINTRSDW